MSDAPVTIVVSPRERFDVSVASLRSIIEHTEVPYELVYVDGGSPRGIRRQLAETCRSHGFRFIEGGAALTPNEARNLGSRDATTRWVLFADNDLVVEPGWLSPLIACGDETGAGAVTPLVLQGSAANRTIHISGGFITWQGEPPNRTFVDDHRHQGRRVNELETPLVREPCDFVEFHCCLVRKATLDAMGGLDEELRNTREHIDLSLSVVAHGGTIWFEPTSVVTYTTPTRIRLRDVAYYCRRWGDVRTTKSLTHFCAKWGIDPSYAEQYMTKSRRDIVFDPVVHAVARVAGDRVATMTRQVLRKAESEISYRTFGRTEESRERVRTANAAR